MRREMKASIGKICGVGVSLAVAVSLSAKVWYVAPGLTPVVSSTRDGHSWEQATRLESALDSASKDPLSADVIRLKSGDYIFESPSYRITHSVTLQGGYSGLGEEKGGTTRLRQLHGARVLVIQGTSANRIDVHVKDLWLEDGDAGKEDGLVLNGIAIPQYKGGIIYSRYARTTLENVRIMSGIASAPAPLLAYGGGIYHEDGILTLRDVTFAGNEASAKGGALASADGVIYLEGANVFKHNSAPQGGGITLLSNSLLSRRSGTLLLSHSGFHVDPSSMDESALKVFLFRPSSDFTEVLLEESPLTPEEEFPFLRTISFSQWNPSGSNQGVNWKIGIGCETITPSGRFLIPEGSKLPFRLVLNGTPIPSENLLVTAGSSRTNAWTLYPDESKDYLYTMEVSKDDSVFAMPESDLVSLVIDACPDSILLLSLTEEGGNIQFVQTGDMLKCNRHARWHLSTRASSLKLSSGDIRATLYPMAGASGGIEEISPVFLANGVTAFDFPVSGNRVIKVYLPSAVVPVNPMLSIDSLTIERKNADSTVEKPPLLRPLVAGVDTAITLHVTTSYQYQWDVTVRSRELEGGDGDITVTKKEGVVKLSIPDKNNEVEVFIYLVGFPEIKDSFTVQVMKVGFGASIRVKKGEKTPLPTIRGTEGAIAWRVDNNRVSLFGDSILADAINRVKVTGTYNPYVYGAGGSAEVEVDVVDLRIKRVGLDTLDVTGKSLELLVGQGCTFESELLFEEGVYKGTKEIEWELISPDAGVTDYHANGNGVVLTGLKRGSVTLKARLKGEGPEIISTVVVHVGNGFGSGGIKGGPVIRYHDCTVVTADIELAPGNSLRWKSSDSLIISVEPIGGNEAILSAVDKGEALISVYFADDKDSVSKVFKSIGLVRENKGGTDVMIPVSPGDALPLPCHLVSKEDNLIVWEIAPAQRAHITGNRLYISSLSEGGSYGDVTVTAKVSSNPEIKETFIYKVIGFSLSADHLELDYEHGDASIRKTLKCVLEGTNTESIEVLWKVLDTTVVKPRLESNRELSISLPMPPQRIGGETTVTVFCVDNPSLQASCAVKTKAIYPSSLQIKAIHPGPYLTGETYRFEIVVENWETIDPAERIGWRTLDPEVIRVMPSNKGAWVQPVVPGTATLQAYVLGEPDGPVINFPLEAYSEKAGIYLKEGFVSMKEYTTYVLEYAPYPNDLAGTTSIEWTSEDPKVVDVMPYVTPDGEPRVLLISYASGESKVTGKIKDVFGNEYTSSCVVQVLTPVESLILESSDRVLWKGETYALNLKVYPPTASHVSDIKYESLDKQIATVDQHGIVTAVGTGKAIIRASVSGESKVAYCYVTVAEPSSVGVVIVPNNLLLYRGSNYQLSLLINPYGDATSLAGTVPPQWTSSDKSVAAVTGNGKLLALSEGVTYIRATTADGWNSQECVVRVEVPAESLAAPEGGMDLVAGESASLIEQWKISPSNATVGNRPDWGVWEVSDVNVAEVDEFGTVWAKSPGTTRVTATVQGYPSLKASSTVRVSQPSLDAFSLSRSTLNLRKGEMSVLSVRGANGPVEWQSSDGEVVSVDANGNVVGKAVGTAVITASNKEEAASCVVTVGVYAEALFITPYEPVYMKLGDRFTMTATVIPQEAETGQLQWQETSTSLLSLTKEGNKCTIEALRTGTAVLYVSSPDGRAYRSWVIRIGDQTSTEEVNELLGASVSYKGGTLRLQHLGGYVVKVWSLSGRSPLSFEVPASDVSLSIDLPTGVYLLRAVDKEGKYYTTKFMAP
ncbi:MAG: Ig-like domain-containing protein [Tannerellaceae bacterium]|jgi:uncharacterized protein YjdB|nr:Ig-like domain-containing protein [Tannerellaceae bacterium]